MIRYICAVAVLTTGIAFAQNDPPEAGINNEVRHELVMLPYLDVFDNLAYRVDGNSVTLSGQVTRPHFEDRRRTCSQAHSGRERCGQPD
jgi:hypothetical protein